MPSDVNKRWMTRRADSLMIAMIMRTSTTIAATAMPTEGPEAMLSPDDDESPAAPPTAYEGTER